MSVSTSSESAIIVRLRIAGCVFAEEEAQLLVDAATTPEELEIMVERRVGGTPLEQVLGWAQFCGLRIKLDPGVFVPRRRTEFLVEQAASLARPCAVIVDLCCGSGAVGMALIATVPGIELFAADIDPAAVRCARRNLDPERVFEGDLYQPLPVSLSGRINILVANAPYVPTDAIGMMPPEARLHEAMVALDGGADGVDIQRRVAAEAAEWLAPGGHLLIETSRRQAPATVEALVRGGLTTEVVTSDELSATVVIGTMPSR